MSIGDDAAQDGGLTADRDVQTETRDITEGVTEGVLEDSAVQVRHATVEDAAQIWQLVRDSDVLDENSCYAYLLLCRDFSATSFVADMDGQLVGFLSAYVPPQRPDVLFVWQVAVQPAARRRGIGRRLLHHLLATDAGQSARFVEATVTRSNTASRRLFEAIAAERGASLAFEDGFTQRDFGSTVHEAEETLRIQLDEIKQTNGS